MHPIIRLRGVPTAQSIGAIDKRIGDEFTSSSHHPFVFALLDQSGYGSEQRSSYGASARSELAKLATADWTSPNYTAPPGQAWLALWYFNFSLLTPSEYDDIYNCHRQLAPTLAEKMDLVRESWMLATKNTGAIKPSAGVRPIQSFQSHLAQRLDLNGRVAFQSFDEWRQWLFQSIEP